MLTAVTTWFLGLSWLGWAGIAAALFVLFLWWRCSTFKDPVTYTAYLKEQPPLPPGVPKVRCTPTSGLATCSVCSNDGLLLKQRPSVCVQFCVVGAGFCGLGVCAALKRHHIEFDAYEADDKIGGNWYHGKLLLLQGFAHNHRDGSHLCYKRVQVCTRLCTSFPRERQPSTRTFQCKRAGTAVHKPKVIGYDTHDADADACCRPKDYPDFPSKDQMLKCKPTLQATQCGYCRVLY